jgi:hypothetical protein
MKVYLSHSIRGIKGNEATNEDMAEHCKFIKQLARELRNKLTRKIELYVPAEHEEFVHIAYVDGYLTEHQILSIDCRIIDTCALVLCHVYDDGEDHVQGGRKIEVDYAVNTGKAYYMFYTVEQALSFLNNYMTGHN